MSIFIPNSPLLKINFNGTVTDLKKEIRKVETFFSKFSVYTPSINIIKKDIIPNFKIYKDYSTIYINNICISNISIKGFNPYFTKTTDPYDQPLYGWEYTKLLLYLLIIFIFFVFVISIYCYIYDISIYTYIYKLF